MAYAFDSDNYDNYTKPSREYGILGVNYNQQLVPLIQNNPYAGMETQYMADPNGNNSYFTLMKENNGQPYSTIAGYGYPNTCSFYNIIQCPTNKVIRKFGEAPPMGTQLPVTTSMPLKTCDSTAVPTLNMTDIIRFMNYNHFVVYADASSAAQVLQIFPEMLRQGYLTFVDITTDAGKADMASKGMDNQQYPIIVSSASGAMYRGVPPSFPAFQSYFMNAAAIPFSDMNTSTPQIIVDPAVNFVLVWSKTCPYSRNLYEDVMNNATVSMMTKAIEASDVQAIMTYVGKDISKITAYPFTVNLKTGKSIVGYNASMGVMSLINQLQ